MRIYNIKNCISSVNKYQRKNFVFNLSYAINRRQQVRNYEIFALTDKKYYN